MIIASVLPIGCWPSAGLSASCLRAVTDGQWPWCKTTTGHSLWQLSRLLWCLSLLSICGNWRSSGSPPQPPFLTSSLEQRQNLDHCEFLLSSCRVSHLTVAVFHCDYFSFLNCRFNIKMPHAVSECVISFDVKWAIPFSYFLWAARNAWMASLLIICLIQLVSARLDNWNVIANM